MFKIAPILILFRFCTLLWLIRFHLKKKFFLMRLLIIIIIVIKNKFKFFSGSILLPVIPFSEPWPLSLSLLAGNTDTGTCDLWTIKIMTHKPQEAIVVTITISHHTDTCYTVNSYVSSHKLTISQWMWHARPIHGRIETEKVQLDHLIPEHQ